MKRASGGRTASGVAISTAHTDKLCREFDRVLRVLGNDATLANEPETDVALYPSLQVLSGSAFEKTSR